MSLMDYLTPQNVSTGLGLLGGFMGGQNTQQAGQQMQQAAQQAKFKPFGVTTAFGQSGFQYDPSGNLIGGSYMLSPGAQAQRDALFGQGTGLLGQFNLTPGSTAPMAGTAEQAMKLGQQYMAANPQEQAQKWMTEQQNVLAPGRAEQLAGVRANLNATGRTGLAVGGDAGMMASNPEMAAYYNAVANQDRQLASQATQQGMDYAKFGTQLSGAGGQLLQNMFQTQTAAFDPYAKALGGAYELEKMGQQPMSLSQQFGKDAMGGGQASAQLAANAIPYANYSPWSGLLSGAASGLSGMYKNPQGGWSTSWS